MVADVERDVVRGAEVQDCLARDALGAGVRRAREHPAIADKEDVRAVAFRDEAVLIQEQGGVRACGVGLDLREDALKEVVGVDLGVQAVRREAAYGRGGEREAGSVVDGRLELREDDQRGAGLVEPRVHPARDLRPAREREPDVDAVAHVVGVQRAAELLHDGVARGYARDGDGFGGVRQPREVLVEAEDLAVVEAEAFPDAVAALHERVEGGDARFVAVEKLAVDVDDEVAVALVEGLQHG